MNKTLLTIILAISTISLAMAQKNKQQLNGTIGTAIDLGLSSGTLWADHNLGADAPESFGDFFAWGNTEPNYTIGGDTDNPTWKKGCSAGYTWKTCKNNGSPASKTKHYKTQTCVDETDNKPELYDKDDAAVQLWGDDWKIPSKEQINELLTECDWEWTTVNGVNGYKVKSRKNNNYIFLPTAGFRRDLHYLNKGEEGLYWSRTFDSRGIIFASSLNFKADSISCSFNHRYLGFSIRPICYSSK